MIRKKQTTAKRPTTKKAAAKRSTAKRPTTRKPAPKRPAPKRSAAKRPTTGKAAAKRPAAKQPAAKQPAAGERVAKRSARPPAVEAARPERPLPLIDLADAMQILLTTEVPAKKTYEDQPVVAWARIGGVGGARNPDEPKSWIARLSTTSAGRLDRDFVSRAASRKAGYQVVCEDPFLIETYFQQDHPLVPGVYEASSTCKGGPEGYQGRAAFDVLVDGRIEIVAVGPRATAFDQGVQDELARRIASHDERDGGRAKARREREREDDADERQVRGDELIEKYGLPDLAGSPKQVRWAMDIRQRALEYALRTFPGQENTWTKRMRAQTEARWWIDHRDNAIGALSQAAIAAALNRSRA